MTSSNANNSSIELKRAALRLAKRGKAVFPCKRNKAPHTTNGYLDATTHPDTVNAWWRRWPEANTTIPTGKASGILIVDLDTYKSGAMTVEEFEEKYGKISHTTTARTGNGGLQYYFIYPDDIEVRNSAGMLGKHVDVRGEGGYTLTPSSVTTGPYEWINKAPPAPVPPKLLEAIRENRVLKETDSIRCDRRIFKLACEQFRERGEGKG